MSASRYVPMTPRSNPDGPPVKVTVHAPDRCDHKTSVCASVDCLTGWANTHLVHFDRTARGRQLLGEVGPPLVAEQRAAIARGELTPAAPADPQWTYADIAEHIGATTSTVRKYVSQGRLPDPDGRLGQSPWWRASRIIAWHRDRPGRGVGGGRPRRELATTGA